MRREAVYRLGGEGERGSKARQRGLQQNREARQRGDASGPGRRPDLRHDACSLRGVCKARRNQLASRLCESSESRKACASSFFSKTCGAMLRRVNASPSFMRMKALVAKRVIRV